MAHMVKPAAQETHAEEVRLGQTWTAGLRLGIEPPTDQHNTTPL